MPQKPAVAAAEDRRPDSSEEIRFYRLGKKLCSGRDLRFYLSKNLLRLFPFSLELLFISHPVFNSLVFPMCVLLYVVYSY